MRWPLCLVLLASLSPLIAAEPTVRNITYHGYSQAIELKLDNTRAVVGPQVGGRVLEFSVGDVNAMYLDDAEKNWKPGERPRSGAGRFDYGPELTVTPHPKTWSGDWTAEISSAQVVKLTGPRDEAGIQVEREFRLIPRGDLVGLACKQTLTNISQQVREVCHWGRSFSPAGGICVIPLGERPSRFPSKYVLYEEGTLLNVKATDDKIREREGCLEILGPPRKPKMGFDTTGTWLAYLMPNQRAFVKRFPTYPDRVYNEAAGLTLSVWSPKGPQIELEPIGPREFLKPGQSASFTEDWWLISHPFPKGGEQVDLKKLAEQVLKETALSP